MEFSRLVIEEARTGPVSCTVQTATAEFFGWEQAFPGWLERFQADYPPGRVRNQPSMKNPLKAKGGKRLYICRDKSTTGHPGGKTHCFRMKGAWSRKHLVQLAVVAGEKFEWMESAYGERVKRDDWLALAR